MNDAVSVATEDIVKKRKSSSVYKVIRESMADCHAMLSHFSHVSPFVTPWTEPFQAPLYLEFSRQEYWRGLPFSSTEDLFDPGIKPRSPALQADSCHLGSLVVDWVRVNVRDHNAHKGRYT